MKVSGIQGQSSWWGVCRRPQKLIFLKICYTVTVLRMTAIYAFIAYKCSGTETVQVSE